MAEYWLKSSAEALADGPLSAAEVKRRAASGEIARDTLISMDNAEFYPAGRVKGVFQTTTTASKVATATAPPKRALRGGLPPTYPGGIRTVVRSIPVTPPPETSAEIMTTPASAPAAPPPPPLTEVGDGSIESQPAMPLPSIAPPPPPRPASALSMPMPLPSQAPAMAGGPRIVARKTTGFLIVAIIMLFVGVAHAAVWYLNFVTRGANPLLELLRIIVCLAWIPPAAVALVLWLKWLNGAHKDIAVLTGYGYRVSPAKATGFSVIPLFDIYWAVSAPTRLAGAVNSALESAGQPKIARGAVTACQLLSILAPFVGLYAITPLMYAMSMRIIQRGFNRLVALQYAR